MPSRRSLLRESEILLYLPLNDNCIDYSGLGNHGTPNGITYTTGKVGNCAEFNATGDKILVDRTMFNFDSSDKFSVSFWFKLNTINVNRFFVSHQLASGQYTGWAIWQDTSNRIKIDLVGTSSSNLITVRYVVATTGSWKHICITYDGSSNANGVKFYVDGQPVTTDISANTLSTSIKTDIELQVGNRNGAFNLNGFMDEIFIYKRTLSDSEVLNYYNSIT